MARCYCGRLYRTAYDSGDEQIELCASDSIAAHGLFSAPSCLAQEALRTRAAVDSIVARCSARPEIARTSERY